MDRRIGPFFLLRSRDPQTAKPYRIFKLGSMDQRTAKSVRILDRDSGAMEQPSPFNSTGQLGGSWISASIYKNSD